MVGKPRFVHFYGSFTCAESPERCLFLSNSVAIQRQSQFSISFTIFVFFNEFSRLSRSVMWHDLCFVQGGMGFKVLIVEDNTDCRELFAMIIRHLGFQVVEADDGEIGVQKALSEKPDLIFMDIGMPSMSGIEATVCLREIDGTKNVPIIICTAWMAEKYREAALKCGADEVIMKPVSLGELQTILLRYLPAPSQADQIH
jgi:twitching motility two-component system response regulator PilH